MNEVIKTILGRRSIQAFEEKQLNKEDLDAVLECARYAPSVTNTEPAFHRDPRSCFYREGEWLDSHRNQGERNPNLEGILERSNGKVFRNTSCVVVVSNGKGKRVWGYQCLGGNAKHAFGCPLAGDWISLDRNGRHPRNKQARRLPCDRTRSPEGICSFLWRDAGLQRLRRLTGAAKKGGSRDVQVRLADGRAGRLGSL